MTDRPDSASPEGVRLPENAFRPLAPGERYEPVVPPAAAVPETTLRSLLQGALWAVVFSNDRSSSPKRRSRSNIS